MHIVARITTFVTNLSRSKIQYCKSAEFYIELSNSSDWPSRSKIQYVAS